MTEKTTQTIICGDNIYELPKIPDESVDLIYIDPPFFTNETYEVVFGDGYEKRMFEDRFAGKNKRETAKRLGIGSYVDWMSERMGKEGEFEKSQFVKSGIDVYIEWMRSRIQELYRVLKKTGSFYLHCDPHADVYLKIVCDEIFGYDNLVNEIIWNYGARATVCRSCFPSKHDNIYWYRKGKTYTYNEILTEYKDKDMKRYNKVDEKGEKYALIKRKRTNGEVYYGKCYPREGVPITDVWDIPTMSSTSSERLGYPTQKPEALLERIILASSNEGDTVLDAFCGCGTTLAVAHRLKRNGIGIETSPTGCRLIAKRVGLTWKDVVNYPATNEELKEQPPFEFQNWVNDKMNATGQKPTGDFGLDGICRETGAGVQVKQSEKVGRNVADNFETALRRAKMSTGAIIAFSFGTGIIDEVARAKQDGFKIRLYTPEDLINEKHFNDGVAVKPKNPQVKSLSSFGGDEKK